MYVSITADCTYNETANSTSVVTSRLNGCDDGSRWSYVWSEVIRGAAAFTFMGNSLSKSRSPSSLTNA